MTNFIYNMQDELFDLNMILPVGKFSPIKKLVDHIEAQGKQLRELDAAITKKNATIKKYEREKKELQNSNNYLVKKVNELNEGIRDSEDLTWKQKYDALLQSSEQAIGALQKKCQEYKNSESDAITSTIETLTKTNKELEEENKALKEVRRPWGDNAEIISAKTVRIKELEEKNKKLEHDYNELVKQRNGLYYENKKLERSNLDLGDTIGMYVEEFKKLKDYISELENEMAGLKKELAFWKTDDKRSFFGESFDMHSIYDLNRLEEVIADKIKSYDSRLYSIMAERDKYKESSETYRLKLMAAERQVSNDYISELEEKNKKLKKQVNSAYGVISLSSELNTKIDNQSKEITRLLRAQEKLKTEIVNKEQIISSLDATINHKNKLLDEYMTKCDKLGAENEKLKKEEETYRIKFLRSACSCHKAEETLSKIRDLIDEKE